MEKINKTLYVHSIKKNLMMLIFILPILLCSCKDDNFTVNEIGNLTQSMILNGECAFGDDGILLSNNSHLTFFNPESNTEISLCTRADCDHSTSECDAYIGSLRHMLLVNKCIYYLTMRKQDGIGKFKLNCMDCTGNNRKELAEVNDALDIEGFIYGDNLLSFSTRTYYDKDGNELEKTKSRMFTYDLNTGKLCELFSEEGFKLNFTPLYLENGVLWYFKDYTTEPFLFKNFNYDELEKIFRSELHKFVISTKEDTIIHTHKISEDIAIDRCFYFINDVQAPVMIDMRTGEKKALPLNGVSYRFCLDGYDYLVYCSDNKFNLISFSDGGKNVKEIEGMISIATGKYVCGFYNSYQSYMDIKDLIKGKNNWKKCNIEGLPENQGTK